MGAFLSVALSATAVVAVWLLLGAPLPPLGDTPRPQPTDADLMTQRLDELHADWDMPLSRRRRLLWPIVRRLSREAGAEPSLVMAVVAVESRFRPWAVSPAGAMGLMQLTPTTALHLGLEAPINALDPVENLRSGIKYLVDLQKRFDGDINLALAAYNAGPTAVERCGGIPPISETQNYVDRVLQEHRRFAAEYGAIANAK